MKLLSLDQAALAPYGRRFILRDITLQLAPGEVLGLVGPNGAGKSTLLHTLAGGLPLHAGTLRLNQRTAAEHSRLEWARSLAVQSQNPGLNFPFSVEEVVMLGRIPHASGDLADRRIVSEVLAFTDTESLQHRLYTTLSGGERQRVQLARAIAQVWRSQDSPGRVLLMDEPSAALDLAHTHMVADIVRHLSAEQCGVVIASHDFNLLAGLANRIVVMNRGRLHAVGSPATVLTSTLFREVFAADVIINSHPSHGGPLVIRS